ncbi:alpha/beta fold hydrolase [Marivirga salinae]|uniref:Alpha/beta fold hydrolase n=1 Tax=Marivirga salinarum TaxID=3059078 RepID=A0AA51NBP4_9BACT|nr:alpha/beta fold hydrolase [Marivirga sp. BDSF4-3]WMN10661.1 alpha/beta fold hydrolase [Marivirga sp. BDSF4-3]
MSKFLILLFLPLNLIAIDPDREYTMTPDSIGWEYEELIITTEDGYDLNTWIYAANPENQKDEVLILAYPDAGNMSYFVYHASIMANLGYTVVTFDYRGFGKSSDFKIKSEYLFHTEFSNDLKAIVDFTESRFKDQKLGIWALSMGTMVTTYTFEDIKDKIDFLIYDAFVYNPEDHIRRIKSLKGNETFSPIKSDEYFLKWKAIDIPILLFAGTEDKVTTAQDAKSNRHKFTVEPEVKIYDGGHLMGFQHEIETGGFGKWYSTQMDEFIQSNL